MHEMIVSEVLLAWEDAMALYVLTNPFGGEKDGAGSSTSSAGTELQSVSGRELARRMDGVHHQSVKSKYDVDYHTRKLLDDFLGKEAPP